MAKEVRWTTLEVLAFYQEHAVSSFAKEFDAAIEEHEALQAANTRLREAVGLLNSMVLSGENHSEQSKKVVEQALKE